jgi:RinA family phage transcriptional activator
LTTATKQVEAKIKRDVFRHVEAELYAYPFRKKEITRLREEILYPFDERPEDVNIVKGKNSVRRPGDPTAKKAIALVSHTRLHHLERVVDAIDEVYARLPDPKREFVRLKYWTHPQRLTAVGICQELGISDRTYSRWRSQIISQIAEILGWN